MLTSMLRLVEIREDRIAAAIQQDERAIFPAVHQADHGDRVWLGVEE
ncbi:hypothetical protein [Leisingera methylohalidivorans]|uniref:Uncharacterized protein n=1 Tax=Leisingera methylohalidivorans DSM 14336 TaxID=999552 RepID=V9W0P7_9RHOB|nr:hypothetical protein [Leisingera methylohalidivorans]AHD03210.1 hypothetical protein METH_16830 [Leisingera methylohalidivorans DSM 14336]